MEAFHEAVTVALKVWEDYPTALSLMTSGVVLRSLFIGIRMGPGRAIGLLLTSRLFRRAKPFTARTEELVRMKEKLTTKWSQQYMVVMGPMGVGKTVLVRSLTSGSGVVDVEVEEGASYERILHDAYSAILKPSYFKHDFVDLVPSALRVLFFYRLFTLFSRPSLSIVFHLKERRAICIHHWSCANIVRPRVHSDRGHHTTGSSWWFASN